MTRDKFSSGSPDEGNASFRSEEQLVEMIGKLPKELSPEVDVWPAISDGIAGVEPSVDPASELGTGNRTQSPLRKFALAASIVVAFAAGIVTSKQWYEVPQESLARQSDAVPIVDPHYMETLAATELVYQAAFREYINAGQSPLNVPPATIENIEQSWVVMRDTETALTSALNNFPANPFLIGRMMDLRKRQLSFLRQVANIDQNNRLNSRRSII